jgi:acylphosphatase
MKKESRAEILVTGLVQGVGFRYFVLRKALELGLKGYTKNLFTGEVLTVVEGSNYLIEDLFQQIRIGPSHAHVTDAKIDWSESKGEFKSFEVLY